jgi:hypothetical protein
MADLTALEAYALSIAPTFQHRLSILLDAEAIIVLREAGATPDHDRRSDLAKSVLYGPDAYAATLARQLVLDTNLIAAGVTADGSDSLATDGAIRSQIATNWNAWCGIPAS